MIGFVGGLRPWHGVERLPVLLERLLRIEPKVRLVVAGEGPLREPLERELAARRLTERATFLGALPHAEVPAVIRELDVALAPYPPPTDHTFYFSPLKLFEYTRTGSPSLPARAFAGVSASTRC